MGLKMFKHKTEMRPLKYFTTFCLNKIVNLKKPTPPAQIKPNNIMNCG